MKAKRGGYVNAEIIKSLFPGDDEMKRLLSSECNREVLSFFKDAKYAEMSGGGKRKGGPDGPDGPEGDDDMMRDIQEQIPILSTKRQKTRDENELKFPDKCSAVQRAIAIFAACVVQLMYSGATTLITCKYFPEQTQAISNIMLGFLDIVKQNVGGYGTVAVISSVGTFISIYLKNNDAYELINKLYNYATQPIPIPVPIETNVLRTILQRAITICEYDLVPIGRGITIESMKQGFWNKLGEYGVGPAAEEARRKRHEELAALQERYKQGNIPLPPPMGMPARKALPKESLRDNLRKNEIVKKMYLDIDLNKIEEIENARNMIEQIRTSIKNTMDRKERIDEDIRMLEGSEDVVENPAMMQFLDEAKVGSEINDKMISELKEKEKQLLLKIRQLENEPRRLERTMSIGQQQFLPREDESLPIEDEIPIVEEAQPKKSKKTKKPSEGGKRRTNKKHYKKTKKHAGKKHNKKASRKHHKKTHKRN